jgi:hypothetical protein
MERHPFDRYTFESGETLRLINEGILVKMDPDREDTCSGLIHYPDGAMEHIYSTGTILAYGYIKEIKLPADPGDTKVVTRPVKPFPIPDIEVGMKCCFIRFRKLQDSNKLLRQLFGDNIIALKPEDLLFVFTGDIELG